MDSEMRKSSGVSSFKYYVHDSTDGFRFQLIGNLSDLHVAELRGSWATAQSTLCGRRLILDLRALRSADDAGRQWLLSMAHEGAQYLPETYFRDGLVARNEDSNPRRLGIVSRLLSI